MFNNQHDISPCSKCGTMEHINLLDGKPSSGDENDDFDLILCIQCYGPGWCPTRGEEDIRLSVEPRFAPLYAAWAKANRASVYERTAAARARNTVA
jgi:hypothetical protein